MSKTLTVVRPNIFTYKYQVLDGQTLVASLQTKGMLNSKGVATIGGQQWKLAQKNLILGLSIVLSSPDAAYQDILFTSGPASPSGTTQIGGKQYFYKMITIENPNHKRFRSIYYAWFNESQQQLMAFPANAKGLFKTARPVEISDEGEADNNYMLLLMLAMFVVDFRDKAYG